MKTLRPPPADPPAHAPTVREQFALVRRELAAALIEREDEIDLVLTALIAREHVLLVGPPGCGKSLLLDSVLKWTGGTKFSILLTKFTAPEEVFGPVSLAGLRADKYVRVITGKLPEADYAFVDEIWKASSAILNTLLQILNERVYDAGDGIVRNVPLKLCVAAANEWPSPDTGKELSAVFDRFVLRTTVSPIRSQAGRQRLLWARDHVPKLTGTITPAEVELARTQAASLPWSAAAKDALEAILKELAKEGVRPGDRRQFKTVGVVRAFAFLNGADEVQPEHLEVARHCLWDSPEEQPLKAAQVIARIANPAGMRVTQLLLEAEQVLSAADVRNLAEAARAAAKLAEIDRQLAGLKGNGRVEKARAYLKEQLKKLKLASLESV
jgi:MoxR-like ATPase